MKLKKRAAEKLFQESRIAKSRPHRDMVQAAQLIRKAYRFVKMHENNLVNWNALRPRRPFLFHSAGKESKRGRFARHVGSGKNETR